MPLQQFWNNVRSGARQFTPRTTVDSPRLDTASIERMLRGSAHWFTPRAVAGFDEADFPFLPDADRTRLAGLVADFKRLAVDLPPSVPVNEQKMEAALPLFRDIIALLEFDRYGDAEAYRIGKEIERAIEGYRPPELAELRFNTGLDHTGDPGIWIWGILSDEDEEAFLSRARTVRPLLTWASRNIAPELLPYPSFRTVGEQAEVMEGK